MKTPARHTRSALLLLPVLLPACQTASGLAFCTVFWTLMAIGAVISLPFLPVALVAWAQEQREGPAEMVWAPDSSWLVVGHRSGPYQRLYRLPADGSNFAPLTPSHNFDWNPVFSPDGATLVFPSAQERVRSKPVMNLYALEMSAAQPRPLTSGKSYDAVPRVSPDGKRVVYASSRSGCEADLYLVGLAGGDPTPLTSGKDNDFHPLFLPDGETVLFARAGYFGHYSPIASSDWHRWDWYTIRTDGTALTRLTEECTYAADDPDLSPDGRRLVFSRGPGCNNLRMLSLDEGHEVRHVRPKGDRYLEEKEGESHAPRLTSARFSPDGTHLLFAMEEDRDSGPAVSELHLMDLETGQARPLTGLGLEISVARYSPDGASIAFLAGPSDHREGLYRDLWVMNADGTGARKIEKASFSRKRPK